MNRICWIEYEYAYMNIWMLNKIEYEYANMNMWMLNRIEYEHAWIEYAVEFASNMLYIKFN